MPKVFKWTTESLISVYKCHNHECHNQCFFCIEIGLLLQQSLSFMELMTNNQSKKTYVVLTAAKIICNRNKELYIKCTVCFLLRSLTKHFCWGSLTKKESLERFSLISKWRSGYSSFNLSATLSVWMRANWDRRTQQHLTLA